MVLTVQSQLASLRVARLDVIIQVFNLVDIIGGGGQWCSSLNQLCQALVDWRGRGEQNCCCGKTTVLVAGGPLPSAAPLRTCCCCFEAHTHARVVQGQPGLRRRRRRRMGRGGVEGSTTHWFSLVLRLAASVIVITRKARLFFSHLYR